MTVLTARCGHYSPANPFPAAELAYIQWDNTTVSGGNTLDGCSLVDTDGDGNANAAICATLQRETSTSTKLKVWPTYTCNDSRSDRCAGAARVDSDTSAVSDEGAAGCSDPVLVTGAFAGQGGVPGTDEDTRVYCTITQAQLGTPASFSLRNTCSHPSAEPNSDPSDCVLKVRINAAGTPASVVPVVPNASLSLTGNGVDAVGGTVGFALYPAPGGVCDLGQAAVVSAPAVALTGTGPYRASTSNSTVFVGTGGNVAAGTYGWVITYSGDANYNAATFSCVRQFTAN